MSRRPQFSPAERPGDFLFVLPRGTSRRGDVGDDGCELQFLSRRRGEDGKKFRRRRGDESQIKTKSEPPHVGSYKVSDPPFRGRSSAVPFSGGKTPRPGHVEVQSYVASDGHDDSEIARQRK